MKSINKNKSILIAEDDYLISIEIKRMVEKLGYQVIGIAPHGKKAVEMATNLNPDLIIMDIKMPHLDGLEAARIIQEKNSIPIIIMTAYDSIDFVEKATIHGAMSYLIKPPKIDELDRTIKICLARFKDLTELQNVKSQLEKSLEEITLLSEAIAMTMDSVMILDLEGKVIYANEAMLNLHQYPDESSVLGKPISYFLNEENKTSGSTGLKNLLSDGKTKNEFQIKTKVGVVLQTETSTSVIKGNSGESVGFIAITRDITERKKAEKTIKKANIALEKKIEDRTAQYKKAKEVAEQANKLKSEFLENMSHEFRTPMHGILSFSKFGLERSENLSNEQNLHYYEQISKSAKRLMYLLNNLLDLSNLEKGHKSFDFKKINLLHSIKIVKKKLQERQGKSFNIEVKETSAETEVICDEDKIKQVLYNLLTNAIKYSPEETTIYISLHSTHLTFDDKKQIMNKVPALSVAIKDSGIGIPDSELKTIFNKFVQSSKSKTGAGGIGLGLAICEEIITAHNGKIWAENNLQTGTTFYFVLPYSQDNFV